MNLTDLLKLPVRERQLVGLTGGGVTKLDGIPTVGVALSPVPFVMFFIGDELFAYILRAGTDAESAPAIIRGDDYAGTTNEKVWERIDIGAGGGGVTWPLSVPVGEVGTITSDETNDDITIDPPGTGKAQFTKAINVAAQAAGVAQYQFSGAGAGFGFRLEYDAFIAQNWLVLSTNTGIDCLRAVGYNDGIDIGYVTLGAYDPLAAYLASAQFFGNLDASIIPMAVINSGGPGSNVDIEWHQKNTAEDAYLRLGSLGFYCSNGTTGASKSVLNINAGGSACYLDFIPTGSNVALSCTLGDITITTANTNGNVRLVPDGSGKVISGNYIYTYSPGANTAPSKGITLENDTAASAGNQQYSPAIFQGGRGWKTDATAASQSVFTRTHVVPVQGAAAPSGNWLLGFSINGGAYTTVLTVSSAGMLTVSGVTVTGLGTGLAKYTSDVLGLATAGTDYITPAQAAPSPTVLSDGATITWNVASSNAVQNATVTLGGNRTLDIVGEAAGMSGVLIVKQDATGGRTLALPAGSKVIGGGAGAITLTTAANAIDILTWFYDGTNFFWNKGLNYT